MNEFVTAHIEGAQCVGFDYFNGEAFEKSYPNKNQPIAIYCSIGVRSEHIGIKLQALVIPMLKMYTVEFLNGQIKKNHW